MKRMLLLFFFSILFVSGCGGVARMPASEPITSSFAYVTGKYGVFGEEIIFHRVGEQDGSNDVRITSSDGYPIFKVLPGKYMCTSAHRKGAEVIGNLVEFTADAGKITYLGDFNLDVSYILPNFAEEMGKVRLGGAGPATLKVRTSVPIFNNSGKAKTTIRENYPGLAGNLDAIFVYRPATAPR